MSSKLSKLFSRKTNSEKNMDCSSPNDRRRSRRSPWCFCYTMTESESVNDDIDCITSGGIGRMGTTATVADLETSTNTTGSSTSWGERSSSTHLSNTSWLVWQNEVEFTNNPAGEQNESFLLHTCMSNTSTGSIEDGGKLQHGGGDAVNIDGLTSLRDTFLQHTNSRANNIEVENRGSVNDGCLAGTSDGDITDNDFNDGTAKEELDPVIQEGNNYNISNSTGDDCPQNPPLDSKVKEEKSNNEISSDDVCTPLMSSSGESNFVTPAHTNSELDQDQDINELGWNNSSKRYSPRGRPNSNSRKIVPEKEVSLSSAKSDTALNVHIVAWQQDFLSSPRPESEHCEVSTNTKDEGGDAQVIHHGNEAALHDCHEHASQHSIESYSYDCNDNIILRKDSPSPTQETPEIRNDLAACKIEDQAQAEVKPQVSCMASSDTFQVVDPFHGFIKEIPGYKPPKHELSEVWQRAANMYARSTYLYNTFFQTANPEIFLQSRNLSMEQMREYHKNLSATVDQSTGLMVRKSDNMHNGRNFVPLVEGQYQYNYNHYLYQDCSYAYRSDIDNKYMENTEESNVPCSHDEFMNYLKAFPGALQEYLQCDDEKRRELKQNFAKNQHDLWETTKHGNDTTPKAKKKLGFFRRILAKTFRR